MTNRCDICDKPVRWWHMRTRFCGWLEHDRCYRQELERAARKGRK